MTVRARGEVRFEWGYMGDIGMGCTLNSKPFSSEGVATCRAILREETSSYDRRNWIVE